MKGEVMGYIYFFLTKHTLSNIQGMYFIYSVILSA